MLCSCLLDSRLIETRDDPVKRATALHPKGLGLSTFLGPMNVFLRRLQNGTGTPRVPT